MLFYSDLRENSFDFTSRFFLFWNNTFNRTNEQNLKNYSHYDMVDFLLDGSFIEWATGESLYNQSFWTSWPDKFSHKEEVYYQSLEIASNLKIESVGGLTHLELSDLITQINNKIINAEIITSGPRIGGIL